MKKKTLINIISIVTMVEVLALLALMYFVLKKDITIPALIALAFGISYGVMYYVANSMGTETNKEIEKSVDTAYKEVLNHGAIGILTYDDNYQITYMSDFFTNRNLNHVQEKLLNWLPELQDMLKNEANNQTVIINDDKFNVSKIDNASILMFKDITKEYDLNKKINSETLVIGYLGYDNYDEVSMSEDELAYINTNIKVQVMEYFKNFNVINKTLKNNTMLLIMNEDIFDRILKDRFSLINTVRKLSKEGNTSVTISMGIARGSDNYDELDENAKNLLELAQTRGGDQVVVRKTGEDATFFGGTTEAREKQSKTKVRVIANTLKDMIEKSSNVIIVGHKDMDADCVAAALCMSNIGLSIKSGTYIVSKSGGIEPMIRDVLTKFGNVITHKHHFISESEALDYLNENSLVIMVDHHSGKQSNSPSLLKQAKRIAIIDHHRRKADLDIVPLTLYIEASASSTCEIVSEFLPYFAKNIEITPEEANIMYLGILIDTDHFRVRTGSRTFDVLKQLKRYGADPALCDELSQEPYENVLARSKIINAAKQYRKDVIISLLNDGTASRSIASQACDVMVKAKGVEAAFVICNTDNQEVIISARSKGKVNVQTIMEKMHGGGHMTAAGLQATGISAAKLEAELLKVLDEYFAGGTNESNTVS